MGIDAEKMPWVHKETGTCLGPIALAPTRVGVGVSLTGRQITRHSKTRCGALDGDVQPVAHTSKPWHHSKLTNETMAQRQP